jgi:DNA methylase
VWWKGRAAGGSCAWGSFQSPRNPVLRDVTERIVIAGKGRFDRAVHPEERLEGGLPSMATISRDEFLEATTDLWDIPPESAHRVGHPAPFPVELPMRLIQLYTYEDDVVLDPFMGSGSTAVAALRTGRHYVGFDTDPEYVRRARERIEVEHRRLQGQGRSGESLVRLQGSAVARAVSEGRQARELAGILLSECGFTGIRSDVKVSGLGVELSFLALDSTGGDWAFEVSGAFTSGRGGLKRADTLWKELGKAAVLHAGAPDLPLVLITTDAPARNSAGHVALKALKGPGRAVFDLVELLHPADHARLRSYAAHGRQGAGLGV